MFLKMLTHPVFAVPTLNTPMIVDISHPLIMFTSGSGCGKSPLLHSIYYVIGADKMDVHILVTRGQQQ